MEAVVISSAFACAANQTDAANTGALVLETCSDDGFYLALTAFVIFWVFIGIVRLVAVAVLPNEMCGPGGWIINTTPDEGLHKRLGRPAPGSGEGTAGGGGGGDGGGGCG